MKRGSHKQDGKALAPAAFSQTNWEINGQRVFYVCLGDRTLGRGTSAHDAWGKALNVLKQERAA